MDGAAFLLAIFGVCYAVYWVWRNDATPSGSKTSGLLAMLETSDPAAPEKTSPADAKKARQQRPRPYWEKVASDPVKPRE